MDEKFDLDSIDRTFTRFRIGAKVQATVVEKLKNGLLLNIGGKKDGIIPFCDEENESISNVKVGDVFEAIIISTKDDSGAVVLSKKKADDLKHGNEMVNGLKVGDNVNLIIVNFNRAGLISNLGNFEVFIPASQISIRYVDNNFENYVNKQVKAVVVEIDILSKKIIASIKACEENEKHNIENSFWQAIFDNKIVNGKVVRFTDFGAFVNVDGVDCLVHNSEASWDKSKNASEVLELDKNYDFKVIRCDRENKRVALSYKATQENPITKKIRELKVGDIVQGEVKKILPFGAIVGFGDGFEGLLHIKESSHFYVKNIYEVAKVGQKLELKIIDIDAENNKVSLSLKALQQEPEVLKFNEEMKHTSKKVENENENEEKIKEEK
ncbi:MAG: S1 RNA-binding domain-containing protein [Clostridia bacterium]|nr:S1 RNA-binding domain-containing protein [Clostridia bacterium]